MPGVQPAGSGPGESRGASVPAVPEEEPGTPTTDVDPTDVEEIPIGMPVSPEEFRRLKAEAQCSDAAAAQPDEAQVDQAQVDQTPPDDADEVTDPHDSDA